MKTAIHVAPRGGYDRSAVMASNLPALPPPLEADWAHLELRAIDDPEWLALISAHPAASPFHHPAWAHAIAGSYGFSPMLAAIPTEAGGIAAGLPLMFMRGPLRRRQVATLPFTDYCPPLARDGVSAAAFLEALARWLTASGVRGLDIPIDGGALDGIQTYPTAVRHVLDLSAGLPAIESRLKGSPVYRAVRKAQREGVEVRLSNGRDDLEIFYRLHWETRRRLGVPVQPHRFIETIWSQLVERGLGFCVIASLAKQPIAAALYLHWNETVVYKYGASDERFWQLRPNNGVMWRAVEWACANGYRRLDLGKSDANNQGLRDYKRRWGARELLLTHIRLGDGAPSPANGRALRLAGAVIRHSPLIVCRAIGELFYGPLASGGEAITRAVPLPAGGR